LASGDESLPVVEVSLASPPNPLPELSEQIGTLEHARDVTESEGMGHAHQAYNEELRKAAIRIGGLADHVARIFRSTSFFHAEVDNSDALSFVGVDRGSASAAGEPSVVTVSLVRSAVPTASFNQQIEALDAALAAGERSLFETASAEFAGLTDVVLEEVVAAAQSLASSAAARVPQADRARRLGFLQASSDASRSVGPLPNQANVRAVAPDVPFPTVPSMVQDMESRRAVSSGLARAKLLELELSLLKRENTMVVAALRDAVGRIAGEAPSSLSHGA